MRKISQLRLGIYLSYLNLFLGTIIPFAYTPVMLKILGTAEHGLYSLASSTVAYLSILSLGFGTTIIRYVAKYRAENKDDEIRKVYGFFILLYSAMAMMVCICGWLLSQNVNSIFSTGLSIQEQSKMKKLVLIMTASTALSFPLSVFSSMISAYEQFVFRNIFNILSTVIVPLLNLVALFLGYKSIGMAFVGLVTHILFLVFNIFFCTKRLNLKPKFQALPKELLKEIFSISFYNFIGVIVDMLFWTTDKVILGMLANTTAVSIYNIGSTFNNTIVSMSTSITGVLAPKVTGMVVKKSSCNELTDLFIKIGRLQFIIIGLVVSGFVLFGRDFIYLWVGNNYSISYYICLLTIIPLSIPLIQNTGLTIMIAQNKQKFRSITYLIIAIVNAVSTYFVVPKIGVVGAALCSAISYIVGQGIIMNCYYFIKVGIDIPLFWRNIIKMSIIPFSMLISGFILGRFFTITNWQEFFLGVFLYSVLYVALMFYFVMNQYEKDIFLNPINKIVHISRGTKS